MFGMPWRSGLSASMGNLQPERLSMYVNAQIMPATGGIVVCGIRILIQLSVSPYQVPRLPASKLHTKG